MKATGIVRRIDDLGRVVIPKEIRRTMRIREGDPLEIYTSHDGEVVFKKYSAVNEMAEDAGKTAEVISKLSGSPTVIFDRDHVVAVAGTHKKEYLERRISPALEDLLESRRSFVSRSGEHPVMPVEGISKQALAVFPIISAGDCTGAVAIIASEEESNATKEHEMLAKAGAMLLGKRMEE